MSEINTGMVAQSTPTASQPASTAQTSQVNAMLLSAFIQMLETMSQTIK